MVSTNLGQTSGVSRGHTRVIGGTKMGTIESHQPRECKEPNGGLWDPLMSPGEGLKDGCLEQSL